MVREGMQGSQRSQLIKRPVLGVFVSLLVTVLTVALCAALIEFEIIGANSEGYCAVLILLISVAAGSAVSMKSDGQKQLLAGVLTGAGYFMVLLLAAALLFRGEYNGVGVTAIIVFAGSVLPLFLGVRKTKTNKRRSNKTRHR